MTDSNDVGSEYEALVRRAMSQGLQGLDCTLVQLPSDQNGHHGVVLAAVTTDRGVFRAVGEAWRDLLPPARRGETLTTAEIRAKSRALREALGMPALSITHAAAGSEELVKGTEADSGSIRVTGAAASAAESTARPAAPARAGAIIAGPTPPHEMDSRNNKAARAGTRTDIRFFNEHRNPASRAEHATDPGRVGAVAGASSLRNPARSGGRLAKRRHDE